MKTRISEKKNNFLSQNSNLRSSKFYAKALLKKYGEWIEFPRTGMRGRPKNPALVPDKDLKYAQVIINRKGRKLQKVKKKYFWSKYRSK